MVRTFEDLECYKLARDLRRKLSQLASDFPSDEKYRLKDQIVRASRSVTANIAEGFGRHHHQENLQFARLARGSLWETLDHLNVALDENYIARESYEAARAELETVARVLNGYIGYLQKCANAGVPAATRSR